jgi:hypothetical protein
VAVSFIDGGSWSTRVVSSNLAKKDMDVNERERLSNITLKTQIKVK